MEGNVMMFIMQHFGWGPQEMALVITPVVNTVRVTIMRYQADMERRHHLSLPPGAQLRANPDRYFPI